MTSKEEGRKTSEIRGNTPVSKKYLRIHAVPTTVKGR